MRALLRVVAAILVHLGRVLVARRAPHQKRGGLWEFPGGKVEVQETDRVALARELREELGITVAVHEGQGEVTYAYPDVTICLAAYRCELQGGTPHPHEHAEVRWVTADELDGLDWAPADVPLLPAVKSLLA